jgi:hypothetical protein
MRAIADGRMATTLSRIIERQRALALLQMALGATRVGLSATQADAVPILPR